MPFMANLDDLFPRNQVYDDHLTFQGGNEL